MRVTSSAPLGRPGWHPRRWPRLASWPALRGFPRRHTEFRGCVPDRIEQSPPKVQSCPSRLRCWWQRPLSPIAVRLERALAWSLGRKGRRRRVRLASELKMYGMRARSVSGLRLAGVSQAEGRSKM